MGRLYGCWDHITGRRFVCLDVVWVVLALRVSLRLAHNYAATKIPLPQSPRFALRLFPLPPIDNPKALAKGAVKTKHPRMEEVGIINAGGAGCGGG